MAAWNLPFARCWTSNAGAFPRTTRKGLVVFGVSARYQHGDRQEPSEQTEFGIHLSGRLQRLLEVRDDIVHVLDANRNTHQPVG